MVMYSLWGCFSKVKHCGLTWQVAKHHTVIYLLPTFQWDGGVRRELKEKKIMKNLWVEIVTIITKIEREDNDNYAYT